MWQTHQTRHISIVKNKPNESPIYLEQGNTGVG